MMVLGGGCIAVLRGKGQFLYEQWSESRLRSELEWGGAGCV